MDISVIIAAAGAGTRFGGSTPKQYLQIDGVTVLEKALNAFCSFKEIIIVTADAQTTRRIAVRWLNKLRAENRALPHISIVRGGEQRQDSVYNALSEVSCEYVLIHDAARPFVSSEVIGRVCAALEEGAEAVIPCVQPKDTIRTAEKTLKRSELYSVQTPQGFKTEALKAAYEKARNDSVAVTDDASVTEYLGIKTKIVEGDYKNIKITTQEDMPVNMRIGNGYDVHRFAEGRALMLGCTEIPSTLGLLGHSDADVLAHAIADAILGAAAAGDIGQLFPDTSPETEGMAGSEILRLTAEHVRQMGYTIMMVDSTVIAEKPKLAFFIKLMRDNTAKALGIDVSNVSIKATTEEGLGERSRDGIAAIATCILKG